MISAAWRRDQRELEPGPHLTWCKKCRRNVELRRPIPVAFLRAGLADGAPAVVGRCPTCELELIKFIRRS